MACKIAFPSGTILSTSLYNGTTIEIVGCFIGLATFRFCNNDDGADPFLRGTATFISVYFRLPSRTSAVQPGIHNGAKVYFVIPSAQILNCTHGMFLPETPYFPMVSVFCNKMKQNYIS